MARRLSRLLGLTALAATLSLVPATVAHAADNACAPVVPGPGPMPGPVPGPMAIALGTDTGGYHYRGVSILSPVESPDGHGCLYHPKGTFVPYYDSPLTPIPVRWRRTDCHGNVIAVPYYRGYCRWFDKHPVPYGCADLVAGGPVTMEAAGYGPYTGAPQDETGLLHLGGNGFVPYHTHPPDHLIGPGVIEAVGGH